MALQGALKHTWKGLGSDLFGNAPRQMVVIWNVVNVGNLPSVDLQTEILFLLERILKDDFRIALFLSESHCFLLLSPPT